MRKIINIFIIIQVLLMLASCSYRRTIDYSSPLSDAVKNKFPYIDSLNVYQTTKPLTLEHRISIGKSIWEEDEVEEVCQCVVSEWIEHYSTDAINDGILSVEILFFETDNDNKTRAYVESDSESSFENWSGYFYDYDPDRRDSKILEVKYTHNN